MTQLDILGIALLWVFLLDLSGGWDDLSSLIRRWLTKGAFTSPFDFKPFSCSLCMTFWTGLLYLIFTGTATLWNVLFVCLMAWLTPVLGDLLKLAMELVEKGIIFINNIINKKSND